MLRPDAHRLPAKFIGLIAVAGLLAGACGVSREAVVTTTTAAVTGASEPDPEPTAPADLPDSLGLDPSGTAATVRFADGTSTTVSNQAVIDADNGFRASSDFVNLVLASGGIGVPVENVLIDQLILEATLDQMIATAGGEISTADNDRARTELSDALIRSLGPDADGLAVLDDMGAYGALISGLQARLYALANTLPPAELPCVSHILLDTEQEAQSAIDDIAAGADFATVAIERSTGPSGPQGGDLGCAAAANYVPEFAAAVDAAEIGEVIGPVQTSFGFHVIIVREIQADPSGDANIAIAQSNAEARLLGATVEVNPALGTWDSANLQVIPA